MTGRIVLLLSSPRVAPGLLTWPAWSVLRSASVVYCGDPAHPQLPALSDAGVTTTPVDAGSAARTARTARTLVADARTGREVVWLSGVDGDPGLGEALAVELTRLQSDPPELELLPGSYDLPGARLVDLIRVMDRLRRECPWVRSQTHRSLVRYAVEETYEVVEAIETGDVEHLREELGDLLFQVVFHARMAESFSIDDVAGDLVEKLIRRNPHVFASGTASEVEEIENVWDQLKSEEKRRSSTVEGVPLGLPALALADKLLERTAKAGLDVAPADTGDIGDRLMGLAVEARRAGIDPEQALRDAVRRYTARIRTAESSD